MKSITPGMKTIADGIAAGKGSSMPVSKKKSAKRSLLMRKK